MKGILKIYHPEETLKYHIKSTYCKPVYYNSWHLLEVEVITDDGLDHVEDDSLQYRFPQLSFHVYDFPAGCSELGGKTFHIDDSGGEGYTEVNLYDDEEAYLHASELCFNNDGEGVLNLVWQGEIDDFYTNSGERVPFKMKCNFRPEPIEVDE